MRIFFFLFLANVFFQLLYGQDSLSSKTFKELDKLSVDAFTNGNIELSRVYSKYQIDLAKRMNDSVKIAFSFYTYMHDKNIDLALKYCDSAVYYTKKSKHKFHPTYGYLVKGKILADSKKFDKAMENYVIALDYAKKKNNLEQINALKQNMAVVKSFLGDFQEALKLFKEFYEYTYASDFSTNRKSNIQRSLYNLSIIYLKNRKLDSARYYCKLGLEKSGIGTKKYYQFIGVNAQVDYYSENYKAAFDSLSKHQDKYKGNALAVKYYYMAKIFDKRKDLESAEQYFTKVDSIASKDNELFVELKDVYQTLAEYQKNKQKDSLQIFYINKYIWTDSILSNQQSKINPLMELKFDKPMMLAEKKLLSDEARSNRILNYLFIGFSLMLLVIGSSLYRVQVRLKKKIEKLVNEGLTEKPFHKIQKNQVELKVPEKIVKEIKEKLVEFEQSKLVNDPKLNQMMLAEVMDTNSTYLSNYINHFKGMNFPSYLKELRIRIAIERLKTEPELLKYSIKGLASDFGFVTAGAFSKAFLKHTGVRPSQFLSELIKK